MERHWLTVVSGRGDSGIEKSREALDILEGWIGPMKKARKGTYGSYNEAGGIKKVLKSSTGLKISVAFDRAGFSDIHILKEKGREEEIRSLIKEVRKELGIKSPYRDRSTYTISDPKKHPGFSDYYH